MTNPYSDPESQAMLEAALGGSWPDATQSSQDAAMARDQLPQPVPPPQDPFARFPRQWQVQSAPQPSAGVSSAPVRPSEFAAQAATMASRGAQRGAEMAGTIGRPASTAPWSGPLPDGMVYRPGDTKPTMPSDDARLGELGVIKRPDGDVSTEISITVTDPRINGGAPTNIPTLVRGQVHVPHLLSGGAPTRQQIEMAIQRASERQAAGAYLPGYRTISDAVDAARSRTEAKGAMLDAGQDVLGSRPIEKPPVSL